MRVAPTGMDRALRAGIGVRLHPVPSRPASPRTSQLLPGYGHCWLSVLHLAGLTAPRRPLVAPRLGLHG